MKMETNVPPRLSPFFYLRYRADLTRAYVNCSRVRRYFGTNSKFCIQLRWRTLISSDLNVMYRFPHMYNMTQRTRAFYFLLIRDIGHANVNMVIRIIKKNDSVYNRTESFMLKILQASRLQWKTGEETQLYKLQHV